MRFIALGLLLVQPLPVTAAGQRFISKYFFDADKTEMRLVDFKFASERNGMAAGAIIDGKRVEPTLVITRDSGEHWKLQSLKDVLPGKDVPLSLFFVSDMQGWMVTEKALWFTGDFGSSWKKTGDLPKGILKVWFLTTDHGWAIGSKKQVLESKDGGKTWTAVPAAAEPPGAPLTTTYG